jgi:hypothetical protein
METNFCNPRTNLKFLVVVERLFCGPPDNADTPHTTAESDAPAPNFKSSRVC